MQGLGTDTGGAINPVAWRGRASSLLHMNRVNPFLPLSIGHPTALLPSPRKINLLSFLD